MDTPGEEPLWIKCLRVIAAALNAIVMLPCGCLTGFVLILADVGANEKNRAMLMGGVLAVVALINLAALLMQPQGRSLAGLGWTAVVANGLLLVLGFLLLIATDHFPFHGDPWGLIPWMSVAAISLVAVWLRR